MVQEDRATLFAITVFILACSYFETLSLLRYLG